MYEYIYLYDKLRFVIKYLAVTKVNVNKTLNLTRDRFCSELIDQILVGSTYYSFCKWTFKKAISLQTDLICDFKFLKLLINFTV